MRGGTWLISANCSNFPTISPTSPAPTRLFGPLKALDSDLMEVVCVAPAHRPGLFSGRRREGASRTSKSQRTRHVNDPVTPSIPFHRAINPATEFLAVKSSYVYTEMVAANSQRRGTPGGEAFLLVFRVGVASLVVMLPPKWGAASWQPPKGQDPRMGCPAGLGGVGMEGPFAAGT